MGSFLPDAFYVVIIATISQQGQRVKLFHLQSLHAHQTSDASALSCPCDLHSLSCFPYLLANEIILEKTKMYQRTKVYLTEASAMVSRSNFPTTFMCLLRSLLHRRR